MSMEKGKWLSKLSPSLCALLLVGGVSALAQEEADKLNNVLISEEIPTNYASKEKSAIMRSNIKPDESAKSVQIFNETYMQDTQAQTINDVIKMSSNTTYLGDNNGRESLFAIRGFSGVPILRDGLSLTNAAPFPEVFNLESIEVLKGPDSLQYGQSSPGGIVNLVVKKPLYETYAQIELETTSNTSYSPKVDLGGALNDSKTLRYRLVALARHDEGFRDSHVNSDRVFIAPTLAYDISDDHTFTLVSEYLDERTPSSFGTYVNSRGELVADIKTIMSHPDEKFDKTQKIIGFDLDSRFGTWKSNLKYRYVDYLRDNYNVHIPYAYVEATNQVRRFFATQKYDFTEHALQYTLNKELEVFNLKNKITMGADFGRASTTFTGWMDMGTIYALNLSNLKYEALTDLSDHPSAVTYGNTGEKITTKKGIFAQDNLYLSENLILSTGVRYSTVKSDTSDKSSAWTPQIGLVYKLTPETSLYANYSESFTPQSATDINGKILDPEEGEGIELGIKQKLFGDRLALTAAVFKIEKVNVAMPDPINPLKSVASGKQESKGFEFDVSGDITSDWSMAASYGYTSTEDKATNQGKELSGIPKHTANLFTTHYLTAFGLPHFYVGGGVRYLGERYANSTNTIKLDSSLIYSAMVGYRKGNWRGALSVQNITDEVYVESASNSRVSVGTPRTVVATLGYLF